MSHTLLLPLLHETLDFMAHELPNVQGALGAVLDTALLATGQVGARRARGTLVEARKRHLVD